MVVDGSRGDGLLLTHPLVSKQRCQLIEHNCQKVMKDYNKLVIYGEGDCVCNTACRKLEVFYGEF